MAPEDELAARWNRQTGPPILRCECLTDKRRRLSRARLNERPLDDWTTVFTLIQSSKFCRGENDRGWVASFEWAIGSPDVAVQVLEGKYDDRPGRERPFTVNELEDARQVVRAHGGCWHSPRCENSSACQAGIIRQWRERAS